MTWSLISWNIPGAVIVIGLILVLVVLILLVYVIQLNNKLMNRGTGQTAPAPVGAAPVVQAGISEETVAVISAAVAAMMDESRPGVAYAVQSIRRSGGARPVWGFAGMQQNTRPF